MSLSEKLEKIKRCRITKILEVSEGEKTGILNGLLLLSAAAGTLLSLNHTASAAASCTDADAMVNDKVDDTGLTSGDLGLNSADWKNHCWWNWWAHHAFGAGP